MAIGDKVQIGIALPQIFPSGRVDMPHVRDFAGNAERLGYHGVWVQERVLGSTAALEPLSLLSYVAALTSRVRLGVSVLVLPLHNPVQLAKRLSTIDQMSEGRLVVGLGLGAGTSQYPAFGLSPDARVRRFVESVEVMKALWSEPAVHHVGPFFRLEGASMEPKPVQRPRPPIWFGGRHPNALKRAVRHADGWMGAGSSSTEDFAAQVAQIKGFLDVANRDPATFAISKRVYLAIDNDKSRAERRLTEWFGDFYGNAEMASRVGVWGSAAHCRQRLDEIVAAGAGHLLLNPVFDHAEHLEALADLVGLARQARKTPPG